MQAVDGDRTSSTLEPHAVVGDRTAEPELPGWLAATGSDSASPSAVDSAPGSTVDSAPGSTVDSAPASRVGFLHDASARDSLGDLSGAGSLTTAAPRQSASPSGGPARRTVTIRGRGAEGYLPWPDASRGRPQRRAYERAGFRPDRLAMWAVLLGFALVLVAILSAH